MYKASKTKLKVYHRENIDPGTFRQLLLGAVDMRTRAPQTTLLDGYIQLTSYRSQIEMIKRENP